MTEEPDTLETLETQIEAVSNLGDNLRGLVERTARIQSELDTAGLDEFAEAVGSVFSALSGAADRIQEVEHDMEIARNRQRSEG